jgi:hypothetical protein
VGIIEFQEEIGEKIKAYGLDGTDQKNCVERLIGMNLDQLKGHNGIKRSLEIGEILKKARKGKARGFEMLAVQVKLALEQRAKEKYGTSLDLFPKTLDQKTKEIKQSIHVFMETERANLVKDNFNKIVDTVLEEVVVPMLGLARKTITVIKPIKSVSPQQITELIHALTIAVNHRAEQEFYTHMAHFQEELERAVDQCVERSWDKIQDLDFQGKVDYIYPEVSEILKRRLQEERGRPDLVAGMMIEAEKLRRKDPERAFLLGLVIMGYTQKEIAYDLGFSPDKVKRILNR